MTAHGARSPAVEGLPQAEVARFARQLEKLCPEGGRLGLAVSGGPDSLALLLLAHAAIPARFEVATVDHGLRPESADESRMVQRVCAARGIAFAALRVTVARGNVQAQARAARYRALAQWAAAGGLSAIVTAHHADDQAETLLMRLSRRCGVAGLGGVRGRGQVPDGDIAVLRPLLDWRKAELDRIAREAGLEPAADPGNLDDRFERARVRKALAEMPFLDPVAVAASAGHLAEADDALEWAARLEWADQVQVDENEIRYCRRAPRAVALRVIARAIAHWGGEPRGADVARLLDRLEAGQEGNVAGVLATTDGAEWLFRPEPPRRAR